MMWWGVAEQDLEAQIQVTRGRDSPGLTSSPETAL